MADLARRQRLAIAVQDMEVAKARAADRSRAGEGLGAIDRRIADRLGPCVKLPDDRAPPVDHLLLEFRRARRGRMDRDAVARQAVARLGLVGQPRPPLEHRRGPLAVGYATAERKRAG